MRHCTERFDDNCPISIVKADQVLISEVKIKFVQFGPWRVRLYIQIGIRQMQSSPKFDSSFGYDGNRMVRDEHWKPPNISFLCKYIMYSWILWIGFCVSAWDRKLVSNENRNEMAQKGSSNESFFFHSTEIFPSIVIREIGFVFRMILYRLKSVESRILVERLVTDTEKKPEHAQHGHEKCILYGIHKYQWIVHGKCLLSRTARL